MPLFDKTPRLAKEEVRVALGITSDGSVDEFVDDLITNQKVTKEIVNNSYFIQLKMNLMCDLETGICL